jgi:PAS domain S-box-containing protein
MSSQRNPMIVRFCFALSLAIALIAIGCIIFVDYFSLSGQSTGRISLTPGGGLMSVMLGASMLALLFHLQQAATAIASLTIITGLCQVALPLITTTESLQPFAINLPLFLVMLCAELTLLAAVHYPQGRIVGRLLSPAVIAIGLLSLLSHWYAPLASLGLGSIPESTIVVSPLAIMTGLVLPFFSTIHRRNLPDFSSGLILMGVFGIVLTTAIWHAMRVQNTNNLLDRAEALADQFQASSTTAFNEDLALIRRLADRQKLLTGAPPEADWTEDVQSYLNDFPEIRMIGTLNPNRQPVSVQSRASQYQRWLERFLQVSATSGWLNHVAQSGTTHLGRPERDEDGHMLAMIASPVSTVVGQSWVIFAVINLEHAYRDLLQHYDGDLSLTIFYDDTRIFDLHGTGSTGPRIPLATRKTMSHHDTPWRIEVYTHEGLLPANALLLPPLVLFGGLTLNFLVMLTQLFWRESERRSVSLQRLDRERKQFFSLSPDMFCIVDISGHFFELNNAFVDVLAYERDELLGASYMQLIHRDDRARVEEAVTAMIAGNTIGDLHVRVVDKNNTEHWLELSAAISADKLIYVAARDTTEIRHTQEKLRESETLLKIAEKTARIGGWVVDVETGSTRWSHAMFDIFDMPFGEVPYLEDALNFYTPESRETITKVVQTCIETGIPFDEEAQIRTRLGRLRWVRAIGQAVKDDHGQIVRVQGGLQDVTASHQTMAELERSNRELQDFAFVASHDLQEPLRKIQAFSDRLLTRSDRFDEQEQDYLRRMQSAAQRMQWLVRDLLTYSRVTTRAQPLTLCNTDRILEEVLQNMETAISQEKAVIDAKALPPVVGDATQIRQVFQNLLSNAIKFHKPEQPPEILIYPEYNEQDSWTLVVSDNGVGFDTHYAGKLFNPFQRLHKQAFPGTGIGLAIVKKILDRHGATVTVDSKVDQGTMFRIRFPTGEHTKGRSHD